MKERNLKDIGININIDEDIKRDIEDFYFSKKDLDYIKIPDDLDNIIDEAFDVNKKQRKSYFTSWISTILLILILLSPIA